MKGRTYRYMEQEPMFTFGFGLSYASFIYSDIKLSSATLKKDQSTDVTVTVANTGKTSADEVVELYLTGLKRSFPTPLYSLKGIQRITLKPGESNQVKFTLTPDILALINEKGESVNGPGQYQISIGGSLPGTRSETLGAAKAQQIVLTIK